MTDGERPRVTAGELWARDQLELLRRARFTPAAAVRFLVASWHRSAEVRAGRPQLARRALVWQWFGAATWVALAAVGREPFRSRLRSGLASWTATALMLQWHLGMLETEEGRPRQLGAADAVTLARAWLVPVVANSPTALVCGTAAVSDALDGQLARRAEPTRAGRDLEGLVDACFELAALRGLRRAGRLRRAPALAELTRLAAGIGYATFAYLGQGHAPEQRLTRAAHTAATARYGGLIAAAAGWRRIGEGLLVSGSTWSVILAARAVGLVSAPCADR